MWTSYGGDAVFSRSSSLQERDNAGDDEEALQWAALERLPTYNRVRRGLLRTAGGGYSEIDISGLASSDRTAVIDRLLGDAGDAEHFFERIRRRFEAVDLEFPRIEVRFQNLKVDAYVHVGSRALPTIPNFISNMAEAFLKQMKLFSGRRKKLSILDNINGVIHPSRMTLLLGPPSSGKTTLLLALAGRLGSDLKMSGSITYNGHRLNEFVPQRTAAYVSQQDLHVGELTVRETLEFAGQCQGVGFKYDMLLELARREKNAGIKPDEDLDLFMKGLALGGQKTSLVVEFILKILGLDICADTPVGDEMIKGISGGQKKRLTTGELLVGPARVLLMDEISTGLDSSTTYQIIKYLRHSTHALDGTTVISLLQPAPETYELFDDIILMCEGQIVYQGPCEAVLDFFETMGFRCPERKNVADFLQEVTSKKDQQQYWYPSDCQYQYVSVVKFAEAFRQYWVGKKLSEELAVPFDRRCNHPAALSTSTYGIKRSELLKVNFSWQLLLMKRNSFIYVFKFIQAEALGLDPREVDVPVIGGHAGVTILPLLSQVKPPCAFTAGEISYLTDRIQNGGTEVVEAKAGAGSATLSMAYAAARFADACLRGLRGDAGVVECSFVASQVTELPFFASKVRLGRDGAEELLPIGPLNEYERAGLEKAKKELAESIQKGVSFIRK